eukprot:g4522.t3
MASLGNAPTARQRQRVCDGAGSSSGGGGNINTLRLRRRAERKPRRVGPYGFILLMSTLVQRSIAAGGFFKGSSSSSNTTPQRPPTTSNHRNENPAPPGGGGGGGRGSALSPAMYTRISRAPPADTDGAGERDRAGGVEAAGVGLRGRHHHTAGVAGPATQQPHGPGFRSGGHRTAAGDGGRGSGQEDKDHHGTSPHPRNSHVAESLLENRDRRGSSGSSGSGSAHSSKTYNRGDGGASAWRGAGARAVGGVWVGHGHAGVSPETTLREAFLAAGRTPSGRRAALKPRADPWDADSGHDKNSYEHGGDPRQQRVAAGAGTGTAGPEGMPGSTPPPRTPLQEQAFQSKYHHHHTQIPGQAVGTQPASSSLFRRAGSGGVFFIFVILVCRALNHYEYADQMMGAVRALSMAPAVSLFVGNLVCMCLSLVQSVTNRQKARMKTMLTVNAVSEAVLLVYNMLLMLGGTSGVVPREEFVSRMLTNVLFMSLCFTFAKARWVADGAF